MERQHMEQKRRRIDGHRVIMAVAILLAVTGVGVYCYPYLSQYLFVLKSEQRVREFQGYVENRNERERASLSSTDEQGETEAETEERVSTGTPALGKGPVREVISLEALYAQMVEYNEHLYQTGQADLKDPFSFEAASFDLTRYGFTENMIGYLEIPRMNITLPVYLGATAENMSKGAAHMSQTSLPVGGIHTNSVIAAHRDMGTAIMFNGIEKLVAGDQLILTNFRERLVYQVSEIKIIHPTEVSEILIQKEKDLLTLITCHPFGYNYQRYVVYCSRVIE